MSEVPHDSRVRGKDQSVDYVHSLRRIAMPNGRCHLHGGKSTGAKTKAGKLRQKMASWKHGRRSKEEIERVRQLRRVLRSYREILTTY